MLAIRDLYLADTVRHDACMACNISRPLDRRLTGTSTDRGVLLPFDGMRRYETDLPGGPQYITYQFGKWWTELREVYIECEMPMRQVDLETFFTDLRSYNVYIRPNHVFEMMEGRVKCKTTRFKIAKQIEPYKWYEIGETGNLNFHAIPQLNYMQQLSNTPTEQLIGVRFQSNATTTDLQGAILYELHQIGWHPQSIHVPIYDYITLVGEVWAGEHWGGDTGIGTYRYTSDIAIPDLITTTTDHSTQLATLGPTTASHASTITWLATTQTGLSTEIDALQTSLATLQAGLGVVYDDAGGTLTQTQGIV